MVLRKKSSLSHRIGFMLAAIPAAMGFYALYLGWNGRYEGDWWAPGAVALGLAAGIYGFVRVLGAIFGSFKRDSYRSQRNPAHTVGSLIGISVAFLLFAWGAFDQARTGTVDLTEVAVFSVIVGSALYGAALLIGIFLRHGKISREID